MKAPNESPDILCVLDMRFESCVELVDSLRMFFNGEVRIQVVDAFKEIPSGPFDLAVVISTLKQPQLMINKLEEAGIGNIIHVKSKWYAEPTEVKWVSPPDGSQDPRFSDNFAQTIQARIECQETYRDIKGLAALAHIVCD